MSVPLRKVSKAQPFLFGPEARLVFLHGFAWSPSLLRWALRLRFPLSFHSSACYAPSYTPPVLCLLRTACPPVYPAVHGLPRFCSPSAPASLRPA